MLKVGMPPETTLASDLTVNINDPDALAQFRKQREAEIEQQWREVVSKHRQAGQLDERGNWIFQQPMPADMEPDSDADFNH